MKLEFRKFLTEATITPEVVDDIRSSLSKDGYVEIFIGPKGEIYGPSDHENWSDLSSHIKRKTGSVLLYAGTDRDGSEYKKVKIRKSTLGTATPPLFNIIKSLKKSGIIDDTWDVDTGTTEPGEYIDNTFTKLKNNESPDIGKFLEKKPITKNMSVEDLTFWHGTSSVDWEQIQQKGALLPLFVGSKNHGYESRYKHEFNKDHIYLAGDMSSAWNYAKARARGVSKSENPEAWKQMQYYGPDQWSIKPVLLKVKVPDITKLRADDDPINSILQNVGRKIWDKKSDEEKQSIMDYLNKKNPSHKITDPTVAQMLWREDDLGFKEIFSKLPGQAYKKWISSLLKTGQVAYKGMIPLKFIEEVPFIPREN